MQLFLLGIELLDLCNTTIPVEACKAFISEGEYCFSYFKQLDEV